MYSAIYNIYKLHEKVAFGGIEREQFVTVFYYSYIGILYFYLIQLALLPAPDLQRPKLDIGPVSPHIILYSTRSLSPSLGKLTT